MLGIDKLASRVNALEVENAALRERLAMSDAEQLRKIQRVELDLAALAARLCGQEAAAEHFIAELAAISVPITRWQADHEKLAARLDAADADQSEQIARTLSQDLTLATLQSSLKALSRRVDIDAEETAKTAAALLERMEYSRASIAAR